MNMFSFLKTLGFSLVIALGGVFASSAFAETVIIVHPDNNAVLDNKTIKRIFLGKQKSFPSGGEAIPLDQTKGSAARDAFFGSILEKNEQQTKAYWSRLVFTGKGTPPKVVGDSAAIKEVVANNPSTIGYIDASVVDSSVKVVLKF